MAERVSTPRHFILVAIGSAGDVHPFVGLGRVLRTHGHRVTLVTCSYFEPLIRRAGLEFVELIAAEEYLRLIEDSDLWHPLRGPGFVMRNAIAPAVRKVYDIVSRLYEPGRTVVGASSLALGARVAQDKLGVPTATIHLQPAVIRSFVRPATLPGMLTGDRVPRSVVRFQYWLADVLVVDRLIGPELNSLRRELGLAPVRRVFDQYLHSPTLTVGLFPSWFGPSQPDWPPQVRLTGFPLYDEHDVTPLSPDVEAFLVAGAPPIAFTPGSAMVHGREFFAAAVEACRRLDRRGILLTRHREQLPTSLPATVRHFDFVPFSRLLPRCAAVVNHGGIGSLSQALAAGVPQVVMPMAHDQFDNARRVERLGVGVALPERKFRVDTLLAAFTRLLDVPSVQTSCRDVAARLADNTALDDTARLLESL